MDCSCPDDGILEDIPASSCPFDLKQIQRFGIAVQGNVIWGGSTGTPTGGVPQADSLITLKADWDARLAAVDNTKMVVTPLIGGDPIIAAGEAITEGGSDNSTLDGVELVTGTSPSLFTAMFRSLEPAQEVGLKAVMCKKVEVYFFLEGGRIAAIKPSSGDPELTGIRIESYFVGDRGNEGFGANDKHQIRFSLPSGWSENLVIFDADELDFNPLFDI